MRKVQSTPHRPCPCGDSIRLRVLAVALAWGVCGGTAALLAAPAKPVSPEHSAKMAKGRAVFKQHVRKVLLEKCVQCHGGAKIRAKLNIATRDSLLRGGSTGPAVVPGKSADSLLYKLITHRQDPHMPNKADKLPDETIAHIAAWIDLGAPYDKPLLDQPDDGKRDMTITDEDRRFWSFLPLDRKPAPDVRRADWCRTDIDRFILARLEAKGLTPNDPVGRRRLIRRAYFDLIGLPPTPEEIDAFINDPDPRAYSRLIVELLASPHYGERWARHWLDVSRFAESHGFEQDYDRPYAYHFRDFVIQALNQDLPYDTFVKWQLAGDEIAPDNPQALMATGFLGAGVFPTQITANEVERTRYDALDDMVNTLGTAMLGLSIGCARCHDHKYDPIRAFDYYRFISTFSTTVRSNIDVDFEPEIYQKAKAKYDREHAPLAAALAKYETEKLPDRFDIWLKERPVNETDQAGWLTLDPVEYRSAGGARLTKQDDGSLLADGPNPDFDTYTIITRTHQRNIKAVRLEVFAREGLEKNGPGRADKGNFALSSLRISAKPIRDKGDPVTLKLKNPRATFEQKDNPIKSVLDDDKKTAWSIEPETGKNHAAMFEVDGDVGFDDGTELTFTLAFEANKQHNIARSRLSLTTLPKSLAIDAEPTPQNRAEIRAILSATESDKQLDDATRATLLLWYRGLDAGWRDLNQVVQDHRQSEPRPNLTKVMVSSEGVKAIRHHTQGADFFEQTYFLKRGDTDQKESVVTPSFLEALMRAPDGEKHWRVDPPKGWRTSYRRTALANWITDTEFGPGHLLARVIVNRLWQHHMGRGIVATPSDFGSQGTRPTHPELLDWLASELIRNRWRLKPIHKFIMTSAVYQQSTQYDAAKNKIDPGNTLYWRRTPRRLEGEVIRDNILAVCGSLDRRMFGPGTLDENHSRRSIYFMIKRSKLIPMMQLFDAPEPLNGIGQRPSTTIAPQALLFMNNPNLRRYAQQFAERVLDCGLRIADCGLKEVVTRAYLLALGREPDGHEFADSVAFIQQQYETYRGKRPRDARRLAMTDFCQVLMSLNEFVYTE